MILKCDNAACKSKFQDGMNGPGMRFHNQAGKPDSPKWRCTVCGRERNG